MRTLTVRSIVNARKNLYTGGYRIYTSIDLSMQDGLQQSVNDTLSGLYRG